MFVRRPVGTRREWNKTLLTDRLFFFFFLLFDHRKTMHVDENPGKRSCHVTEEREREKEREEEVEERRRMEVPIVLFTKVNEKQGNCII